MPCKKIVFTLLSVPDKVSFRNFAGYLVFLFFSLGSITWAPSRTGTFIAPTAAHKQTKSWLYAAKTNFRLPLTASRYWFNVTGSACTALSISSSTTKRMRKTLLRKYLLKSILIFFLFSNVHLFHPGPIVSRSQVRWTRLTTLKSGIKHVPHSIFLTQN